MLTYPVDQRGEENLYEYLYRKIKEDILMGNLEKDEKLPSKRALAKNLSISTITVENAYAQLVAEGYVYSVPKSGYYVTDISKYFFRQEVKEKGERILGGEGKKRENSRESKESVKRNSSANRGEVAKKEEIIDLANHRVDPGVFPFALWTKLMRETMSENQEILMKKAPAAGVWELRSAIANNLYQFRGMEVDPRQIIIGAGTEYLFNLITQLLGFDNVYGIEDPGYQKLTKVYQAIHVENLPLKMDKKGIAMDNLKKSGANIIHITPSHHFPTGLITPIDRRMELLEWAEGGDNRYIIEDDYDSEFRLAGKPIPAMFSIDQGENVIYINTFSKSLTSTIRISYMVLPYKLVERYEQNLSFYSCTVSNFEQYTLAKFMERGYFEKHINRMRNYYRKLQDSIIKSEILGKIEFGKRMEKNHGGLHFLLKVDTDYKEEKLRDIMKKRGVEIAFLSDYYQEKHRAENNVLVINFSGLSVESLEKGMKALYEVLEEKN